MDSTARISATAIVSAILAATVAAVISGPVGFLLAVAAIGLALFGLNYLATHTAPGSISEQYAAATVAVTASISAVFISAPLLGSGILGSVLGAALGVPVAILTYKATTVAVAELRPARVRR